MDLKRMRRSCASLLRDLDVLLPSDPDELIVTLCARMGQRLGVPVRHRLVRFPAGTVSGLWVATSDASYVLCEQDTSSWHRLAITAHEIWHMEAGHGEALGGVDAERLLFSSLDPFTVSRIVAARTCYSRAAEQEAEMFASLFLAQVSRWVPAQPWTVPEHAADVVDRLEASLGPYKERRPHG